MTRSYALVAALLVTLSGGDVLAQSQDDYDAFGFVDDGLTLDDVAPDDGGMAPLPPMDDLADVPPQVTPPSVAPTVVAEGLEVITQVAPPADWRQITLAEATAWVPPDFVEMDASDEAVIYFSGDPAKMQGVGFGIMVLPGLDEALPPEAELRVDKLVTLNGQTMQWREMTMEGEGAVIEVIMVAREDPATPDRTVILMAAAYNRPLEPVRADLVRILGTARIGATPTEPDKTGEALGGLVSYTVPSDWRTSGSGDGMRIGFSPRIYSGYLYLTRGMSVTGMGGSDEDIPAGLVPVPATILGQPAELYSWTGTQAEFQIGASMKPGRTDYYRLTGCVDGDPLGVTIAGIPEYIDGEVFRSVLNGIVFVRPDDIRPCGGRVAAPDVASPSTSPPVATPPVVAAPPVASPAPVPAGTAVDVGGVTYVLPAGWTAQYDTPTDKLFHSPDGKWTLLSFWWFPDEPLLGYDDITMVEHKIIDHEPVTRIHSTIAGRRVIQNVTERARADEKRFIFTLEGTGVSAAELQALHDQLVANLHLQGGFDPAMRVDPLATAASVSGPAPVTLTGVPPGAHPSAQQNSGGGSDPAPTPVTPAPMTPVPVSPVPVNFTRGVQGWTGVWAKLAALPTGGPSGGGVLEVFTPGEGEVGYIIAPASLLGDWSGIGGLRVTIKSQSGTYFGAFEDGSIGDIYLANGSMTAAIAFPVHVGSDWRAQEVSFDDPGWVLEGGARSVAEVAASVTDFRIRAEFFNGDAKAWVSSVEPLARTGRPVPAPEGGWTAYINDRFGTRIDYPANLFEALPPPTNGDGRSFSSADGSARFLVFGQYDMDGLDPRAMMARDQDFGAYDDVTDQASGAHWYAMAGRIGGDLFYRKVVIDTAEGVVHVFEISYPATARGTYDEIARRMGKSFGHL